MYKRSKIDWIIQRSKIIKVIVGFANALDEKNWQKLRGYLANEVEIDYSDFRGEPPQRVTAEEYGVQPGYVQNGTRCKVLLTFLQSCRLYGSNFTKTHSLDAEYVIYSVFSLID